MIGIGKANGKIKIMIEKSSIYHKDKVCDYIANSVQYYYTKNDINSIVSVDVIYTSGSYEILGQVSSSFSQSNDTELKLHVASDLDKLYNNPIEDNFQIANLKTNINSFSSSSLYYYDNNLPSDNSVSVGFAQNNAFTTLPFDVFLANEIEFQTRVDSKKVSKTIVTLVNETTASFDITLSSGSRSEDYIRDFIGSIERNTELSTGSINFTYDDFEDESDGWTYGMSGMKLAGDLYGSSTSVSSGPLAGRDMKQIDKVGMLYSRSLALLYAGSNPSADSVIVTMVYKKGQEQPISVILNIDGVETELDGDYSIQTMREQLYFDNFDWAEINRVSTLGGFFIR